MMRPRKKTMEEPEVTPRSCQIEGCGGHGLHKAPLSREKLDEYLWLCLDHVRAYNQSWDYFEGMSQGQIEQFMQDALTGHRPTWKISDIEAFTAIKLEEALYRFRTGRDIPYRESPHPDMPPEQQKALAILELQGTESWEEIRAHYRALVKKYHPDLHHGSKKSEERFKLINGAFHYLRQQHKPLA